MSAENSEISRDFAPDFDELLELLKSKKLRDLKNLLSEMNEYDIAAFIEELDPEKSLLVFRLLQKNTASDVFAYLSSDKQEHIISCTNDKDLHDMIEDLFVDDVVDLLEELPASVVRRILKNANPSTRNTINQFLKYPEDSAGSIMTAEYVALKKNMTVKSALEYIRKNAVDKETIYTCYVTSTQRQLEGVITLKDLVLSSVDVVIEDIMDTHVIKCITTDEQEYVARIFTDYDLLALPVVDHENRIVGIITVDDAVDVMEEEATEDIEKMAAIIPSEKPYFKTGIFETWKKRIPWLMLLMISATFTGHIITSYEDALQNVVILASFIPMLMDTGGNSGGQSSVTIIRGLSLNEIDFKDILRVISKEFRVALLCGISLGIVSFIKIILIDR
ncbi:MAG: magnesium transporter, partial [Clostridia bacterium]|nr:magnesium transporter [Clostridia bacterium]